MFNEEVVLAVSRRLCIQILMKKAFLKMRVHHW